MASRVQWLNTAIGLFTLIAIAYPDIAPYFHGPEVVYSTNELTTYPVMYHDNMPAPGDIQGKVLAGGLIKMLKVVVHNKGTRSASDVVVKIPVSPADEYLGGWVSESQDPSVTHMFGEKTEYPIPKLLPGDSVTFYLSLGNVNSDLAQRIVVFNGDGSRAEYDPYVPAHSLMSWIHVLGVIAVGLILLLSVSWMRRPKQPAFSANRQIPADTPEHLPATSADSTAQEQERQEQERQDRSVSDGTG